MAQDHDQLETEPRAPSRGSARFVAAGVLGALALGVGLGLWARPTDPAPKPAVGPPAHSEPLPSALQIVVDDTPPPVIRPLEVLPPDLARAHPAFVPPPPQPAIPRPTASGLMKVDAPVAAEPLLVPAVEAEERPKPKATSERKPKPAKVRPKKAEASKVARTDKAKPARQARTEKAQAKTAKAAKLAKADARPKRVASIVKAVKAAPKKLKAKVVREKEPRLAETEKRPVKARLAKADADKSPARPKAQKPSAPRGEGPMRVARTDSCASSDPGEAIVCADRRLSARDRQLQQVYRNAEAAGVPPTALRRQQARWLQARAAAAREAPWAVEDVYVARISELNDQIRDAREN